jgi:hypothetical protein
MTECEPDWAAPDGLRVGVRRSEAGLMSPAPVHFHGHPTFLSHRYHCSEISSRGRSSTTIGETSIYLKKYLILSPGCTLTDQGEQGPWRVLFQAL